MDDDPQSIDDSLNFGALSLEAKERIDRICRAFEAAWQDGGKPRAEAFLGDATGAERSALLVELMLLDLDYRKRGGEQPSAEEYRVRLPQDENLIDAVFRRWEQLEAAVPPTPRRDEMLGSRIGPYTLLSVLGEGGFGIVYLAEQVEPIRRQVAVKILKAGMDTKQVLARFDAERHTLALMDHANIARVFDAGITVSGRSYFVMELVRGEPITAYCDSHKLALKERLGLFLTVCQAVQHAHQKGIIHRDIKPSNVLVTVADNRPLPKIIDFGLAKAIAQPLSEQSIFTGQGQLLGTPEYMSPEQAGLAVEDIDIRSDIYSLGVLLYELLTGTLPFERRMLRQTSFEEICRIIREVEPPRPSDRISSLGADSHALAKNRQMDPGSLHRQLRQELDWIVMKALEKDRNRRYAAAVALAEDIERYLAHEPVQAGPPGNWYRARKYVRRFRAPLAIVAGFAALLVVSTILAVRGYYREAKLYSDAELARHKAESEAEKAKSNFKMARDAVKKYYTRVADDPRLKPHDLEALRRDLLESANEYYEKMIRQDADDPDLQYAQVSALIARGDIEGAIGNWPAAEMAYNHALAAASNAPADTRDFELASIRNGLGFVYKNTGRTKEAEAAHKEAVAIFRALLQRNPMATEIKERLALSHLFLGALYWNASGTREAEASFKAARDIQQTLVKTNPGELGYQETLATICSNLAAIYTVTGRSAEAESAFKQAIVAQANLAEKRPYEEYQRALAMSRTNLANLYYGLSRYEDGLAAAKEALLAWKSLVARHPELPGDRSSLATMYQILAYELQALGRAKDAEESLKESIIEQKTVEQNHPEVPEYKSRLMKAYNNLGALVWGLDRPKDAEKALKEALALGKALVAAHPEVREYRHDLAFTYNTLADIYQDTGRAKEAESRYDEAIKIRKALVEKYPDVVEYQNFLAESYLHVGDLYHGAGRAQQAEAAYKAAVAIWKPSKPTNRPVVPEYQSKLAQAYLNLGGLYYVAGRWDEAEAACRGAVAVLKHLVEKHPDLPDNPDRLAAAHFNLGRVCQAAGRIEDAEAAYKDAIALGKALAKKHPEARETPIQIVLDSNNNLAALYQSLDRTNEAEAVWDETIDILEDLLKKHPDSPAHRQRLAMAYYGLAGIHARRLAGKDGAGQAAGRLPAAAAALAQKAFSCLQRSCDLRLFDDPKFLEHMKGDRDLDGLRNRPEYKKLLEKIAARAKPASKQ
jgi:eukaryotic-like serine/threonine-protein kinase